MEKNAITLVVDKKRKMCIPNGNYTSNLRLCESGLLDSETHLCYDTESKVSEGTSCEIDSDCKKVKIIGENIDDINNPCNWTWKKKIYSFRQHM